MPKNAEPIREGVAVITKTTTMDQMKTLAEQIEQRWGINLNRYDMSELQDMLANTLKMERGKKSDEKWRDANLTVSILVKSLIA